VRLDWEGRTGLGTAVLAREYGITAETARAAIDVCANLLKGVSQVDIAGILNRCEAAVPRQPTVIAALDMALHDLLGKVEGMPVHRLWGLLGSPTEPTAISIGLMAERDRIARAQQLAAWPILKLKMTAAADIGIVAQIREVYAGRLWVDGNGSWDVRQALAAADTFARYGVELLEQPIQAGRPDLLRFVRERSAVPIVADEDCRASEDGPLLEGSTDVINIKLVKCGGLRRALEMIRMARRAGIKIMLGCKTESALGITAMAQLAELADYLDLDGHLNLRDDPYAGVVVECGRVMLPSGPGLGVVPRQISV
jgi:L-alanine-DL-glutamate epimerase-like enolase superfamily enzyme